MALKKVLIITYYWPPAGGPGVQRWLKFSKYLPEFGVEPLVYSPENPSYPIIDESLIDEIPANLKHIQTKIWEPYQIAEKLNPKSKAYKAGQFEKPEKQSFLTKISVFVRGNFFIPDARKFWVKPSVQFLGNYIFENQIDTIVSTGPPHSLHLIGLHLKQQNPDLNWLADFRDPWTQISYHSELKLTNSSQKKHKELESKVLKTADTVIATSFSDAKSYTALGAKKVEVITNGYEESTFKNLVKKQNSKFTITYSGGLEIARNPLVLWKVLNELIKNNSDFSTDLELNFYGEISKDVQNSLNENQLKTYCKFKGYVSHKESIEGIFNSNALLLTNFPDEKSKGIIPGKLFEYMATENPILALGPSGGDVAEILKDYSLSVYCTHSDEETVQEFILTTYRNWKTNTVKHPSSNYKNYSRKSLTEKLSTLIID